MNTKRLLLVLASLWISSLPLSAQTLASVSHAITHDTTLTTTPKNGLSGGMVDDNNSWAVLWYSLYGPTSSTWTEYFYFDGDTAVGEHSYKKVFSCNDQLHENILYRGLMREENRQTYFNRSGTETLMYDFSLEERMSFEYENYMQPANPPISLYVKFVDYVEINGSMKKRIQITETPDAERILDTWIEGIGSLNGILYSCREVIYGNGGDVILKLLCFHQNGELVYRDPDYSECYYEGYLADLPVEKNGLSVYPNPTSGELRVTSDELQVTRIEIFDIVGKMVYGQAYEHTIDISFLPTGLYFLKVYDTNEQVSVIKIIKR